MDLFIPTADAVSLQRLRKEFHTLVFRQVRGRGTKANKKLNKKNPKNFCTLVIWIQG